MFSGTSQAPDPPPPGQLLDSLTQLKTLSLVAGRSGVGGAEHWRQLCLSSLAFLRNLLF